MRASEAGPRKTLWTIPLLVARLVEVRLAPSAMLRRRRAECRSCWRARRVGAHAAARVSLAPAAVAILSAPGYHHHDAMCNAMGHMHRCWRPVAAPGCGPGRGAAAETAAEAGAASQLGLAHKP